jgi:tRNA nucleotidyltransferase/poly(A) polymerase
MDKYKNYMLYKIIKDLNSQDWIKLIMSHIANIYIVGGCCRDDIMNKPIKDVDLVVEGLSIETVKNLLKPYGKSQIVGESFAVIKFRPEHHVGEDYDIAVPRKDRKIGIGHKGFEVVTEGVDIYSDLKRRDFTINSFAVNIKTNEIIDPFNGREDLQNKIIRATNKDTFVEDGLRLMRAIQFAARFRFDIEPHTLKLMKQNANLIKEITGERIKEEFDKIIKKHGSTRIAFDLLECTDIDKALFGQKFDKKGFEYFDDLDLVSFYYVLGNLGHRDPMKYYRDRLKGEWNVIKGLDTLEKYFSKVNESLPIEEVKWNVFLMIKNSPLLIDAKILPLNISKIVDDMKSGKIPMKYGDIPVNGNNIIDKFNVTGEEVGNIMNIMYKDALMNKYNWKSKEETLKYLETIN